MLALLDIENTFSLNSLFLCENSKNIICRDSTILEFAHIIIF